MSAEGIEFKSYHLNGVTIVTASRVPARPLEFLWDGYLARGAINNLVGDGGHGKGYIVADLAARISRGDPFPDGAPNHVGPADVVIFEREDSKGVLATRLRKQGADLSRVHFVRGGFQITPQSLRAMQHELEAQGIRPVLWVFSPLNSYLPRDEKLNVFQDNSVRTYVFDPLAEFAEESGLAILCLLHIGKNTERRAQHRALNSVAYINAARVTLGVHAKPAIVRRGEPRPATPGWLGMLKFNEGPFPVTLAYEISDEGLTWLGPAEEDIRALLEQPTKGDRRDAEPSKLEQAREFLIEQLYPGNRAKRKALVKLAAPRGICPTTLDRAKSTLPIESDGDDWVGAWPLGTQFPELAAVGV